MPTKLQNSKRSRAKLLSIPALALTGMLLAGCDPSTDLPLTVPAVPADIRLCFKDEGVTIPDRALTRAEVEHFWKQDRVQKAVYRRCGVRLVAWADDLRSKLR